MRLDHLLSKEQAELETETLHPTGRSGERNLTRKELSQDSKAVTKVTASQTRKTRVDKTHSVCGMLLKVCEKVLYRFQGSVTSEDLWGFSSVGRAPALQAGGQRFDPANLHHIWVASSVG